MGAWEEFHAVRVPTFEGTAVHPDASRALHLATIPMTVEPLDDNKVKIVIGDVARIVDGISLCDAVNTVLGKSRRRPR